MSCFVHIGLPRCASTYLQRIVFPRLEGVAYAHLRQAARLTDDGFEPAAFRTAIGIGADRPQLLSNEGVSFMPPSGLRNLQRSLPDARLIVVLRNQSDWILSAYCHAVCNAHVTSAGLTRFVERGLPQWRRQLDYRALLHQLADLWGAGNILVLPYETLAEDGEAFVGSIAGFLGSPAPELDGDGRGVVNVAERGRDLLLLNRALNLAHRPFNKGLDAIHRLRRGDAARFRGPPDTPEKHVKAALRESRRALNAWIARRSKASGLTRHDVEAVLAGRFDAIIEGNREVAESWRLDLGSHGYLGAAAGV
jgi:hypothetical protein